MLKYKLCEASIEWLLECPGPLLIRDERYKDFKLSKKDGFPDCLFISRLTKAELFNIANRCNNSPPMVPTYYVPGTSIRGPFRAHAERIIRSMFPESTKSGISACDPFEQDGEQNPESLCCSKHLEEVEGGKRKYSEACPACKLFGCAGLASRIRFSDADVKAGYRSVYREMIGIDRFTGGVHSDDHGGAMMRFHVLEQTKFTTTVTISNFELWQMGLLAYVFRDFEEGLVPIGYGKTKGFGRVQGTVQKITLTYPERHDGIERIEHVGSLAGEATLAGYGIAHDSNPPRFDHMVPDEVSCFPLYRSFEIHDTPAFWRTVVSSFNSFIKSRNSNEPADKEAT